MANVKKGQTVAPPQWWKHLKDWKRVFWKRQRKADQEFIRYHEIRHEIMQRYRKTLKRLGE